MITVALKHLTHYDYDRPVNLGPQIVRLRPAAHCRTPISTYALTVTPEDHFINWQQDVHGNYLARLVFKEPTKSFRVAVELVAEMTVINPFDFFLEEVAEEFPFQYDPDLLRDLRPFLEVSERGPLLMDLVSKVDLRPRRTVDFLVGLNQHLEQRTEYVIRMEPGVQAAEETLSLGSGSCRDSAWLLVQQLRHLGLAARFVSGYLIQLKPDLESLDGPSGAAEDFTDLHAWAEVYLPGAGWVGLDPTSGLFAGEGHIPVACTPDPTSAAPISGGLDECEVSFYHEMSVERVREDPRVTSPYSDERWNQILRAGDEIEDHLRADDVRLTVGGEPTFVSIDDMEGEEWNTAAMGPTKRKLSNELIHRLRERFAPGGLIHYGTGKWYPGESLPRWALTCLWRADGQPVWVNSDLLARPDESLGCTLADAQKFAHHMANRLRVGSEHIETAHEDALYCLWKEHRLAVNSELREHRLGDDEERGMAARMLERGINEPRGCVLPLVRQWWNAKAASQRWVSGFWPIRSDQLFLIPGDSPMGLRLPLDSLPMGESRYDMYEPTIPFEVTTPLPEYQEMREQYAFGREGTSDSEDHGTPEAASDAAGQGGVSKGMLHERLWRLKSRRTDIDPEDRAVTKSIVRTAMCFEPRDGLLHVFMPPVTTMEDYLDLLTAVEQTAEELQIKVVIEGYLPPHDYRLHQLKVTPDPGVIEVNIQPANNWREAVSITHDVYEQARLTRLGTEKFDQDGTHTGTGGGNHVVMGGRTPNDSPFLRRPDLLRSLIGYWVNHPSLSYLFSGRFVGPTSQAPRVDEGRRDALYELKIAFEQIPDEGQVPPWLIDRVFRHLMVDLTGNTHRAEFCIDKLFSPDGSAGRLGLVELRAFEMPPHWQMSLTQQLLLRALVSRFWRQPYRAKIIEWNTALHDRWMLPHYLKLDLREVVEECRAAGLPLDLAWFDPHFEFRFPLIGEIDCREMKVELRLAIEPWYVLGEEAGVGGQARFVDSSVERLQVKVNGLFGDRYGFLCNGRRIPLRATSERGSFVAGIRYRAWQPPSCLHPTITVDSPLVIDIVDQATMRSVGGCTYHVGHPGGLNPTTYPLNSYEAESRRAARFLKQHTAGQLEIPAEEYNAEMPMTLDLRKNQSGTVWN